MRKLELNEDEAKALGDFLATHFCSTTWAFAHCLPDFSERKRLLLQGIKQQLAEAPSLGTGKERS